MFCHKFEPGILFHNHRAMNFQEYNSTPPVCLRGVETEIPFNDGILLHVVIQSVQILV
jgi:hypothetical protein